MSGFLAGLGGVSWPPTQERLTDIRPGLRVERDRRGGRRWNQSEWRRGRIFGTLIGALMIAVIQNGMNWTGMKDYKQQVVLGSVILSAVLLDR